MEESAPSKSEEPKKVSEGDEESAKRLKEEKAREAEIIDALPADLPPEVKRIVEVGFSMQRLSGPMPSPILSKITETHIDKILASQDASDNRAFADALSSRRWLFCYLLLFSGLFVFATVFLVIQDKELYKDLVKVFVAFLGGLGSGWGLKGYVERRAKP